MWGLLAVLAPVACSSDGAALVSPDLSAEQAATADLAGEPLAYDLRRTGRLDIVDSYGTVFPGKANGSFGAASLFPEPPGSGYYGIALADLDRDGNVDVIVGEPVGPMLHVFRGRGAGVFGNDTAFPAGLSTQTIATADFNGDGLPDVATSDYSGSQVVVILNTSK